ncbi:MAG: UvrD-helicase domain-containing protein [Treponema sp.]|nr:UvrD-helicase domain-containing protein [Treponema sp.]
MTDFSPQYLDVLNEEQLAAVTHEGKSLLILAGAGTGKTRVVTTKIAWLIQYKHVDPYSILAVTFTKKAANEMKERAIALEPKAAWSKIRTFHSWGANFLRRYADEAGVSKNFTVYDEDDMATLVSKAIPSLPKKELSQIVKKISLAKDYGLTPQSKNLELVGGDGVFAEQYALYQERLRSTGNVDFGDLILLPYLTLKNNEAIRRDMHFRYRVIMVDEYQDSNIAQSLLLQELSGVNENAGTYVCVVGDDDQSIYRFRGAEVRNILEFKNQFPGTDLIRLVQNYRSTQEILYCADCVVSNNTGRLGKTLVAARGKGKKPTLVFLPTQDDETQFCADIIEQQHKKGVSYSEWAILYRTNAQSLGFETNFLHSKIPYAIVGTLKFYEREEIKDALAWISLVANPRDEVAFRRIVNKPVRGVGPASQDKIVEAGLGQNLVESAKKMKLPKKASEGIAEFCKIFDELNSMLPDEEMNSLGEADVPAGESAGAAPKAVNANKLSLADFIKEVCEKTGLNEFHQAQDEIAGTQKLANLEELTNSAVQYPLCRKGLLDFLDSINLDRSTLGEEEDGSLQDRVTLITLHNTKGLEYKRVIITGMEYGVFPREGKVGDDLEEERRLFYVGITRAQNELYFTSCAMRRLYGRTNYMQPSPFLYELKKGSFRVLGQQPFAFHGASDAEADAGASSSAAYSDPIAKKYRKGAMVYHDDWGHGQIVSGDFTADGEYVVTVNFETGGSKKFLPKYQSSSLLVEGT